jgi:hypothetical protein
MNDALMGTVRLMQGRNKMKNNKVEGNKNESRENEKMAVSVFEG